MSLKYENSVLAVHNNWLGYGHGNPMQGHGKVMENEPCKFRLTL